MNLLPGAKIVKQVDGILEVTERNVDINHGCLNARIAWVRPEMLLTAILRSLSPD